MAGTNRVGDPVVGFQFSLQIDEVTGYFTEVSGIGSENAVATHKVVTDEAKEVTIQVPGRTEWGEITLKRGLTDSFQFWDWREKVISGNLAEARKAVTITMYDRDYSEVVTWSLTNAWPSKLSGPSISADSNDFAIEELTIVHEGLTRDDTADLIPAISPG